MYVCDEASSRTSRLAEVLVAGATEAGEDIPLVSPLLLLLERAKAVVEMAVRHEDTLEELFQLCCSTTQQVVDKYQATSAGFDVSPLKSCIEELDGVAKNCGLNESNLSTLRFLNHHDRMHSLRARIDQLIPSMGLAAGDDVPYHIQAALHMTNHHATKPAPTGVPVCQPWIIVRTGVMDRLLEGFSRGGDPTVMALVGRSGSGKTTAAASFVDLWRGTYRPPWRETHIEARVRSKRMQALFPDGVLWLRVGKGGGTPDHLPPLMRRLAQKLYEEVMGKSVDDPIAVDADSTTYIKKIVTESKAGGKGLCCLVVADDVWEAAVVQKLRETGMWVFVTTRHGSLGFDEGVVVDNLLVHEAERLLRMAAGLRQSDRLPVDAQSILERCHHVAMDVVFVGRWTTVQTVADRVARENPAWAGILGMIDAQVHALKVERGGAFGMENCEINRVAALRAGAMFLGQEEATASKLYAALTVLPDGYGFSVSDATMLLDNSIVHADKVKAVEDAMVVLEQWAILSQETSGIYHVHDAHMHFARANREGWAAVRQTAIRNWTSHISCLKVACAMDVLTLAGLWRALERVGGERWQVSRPYDAQLVALGHEDPSKVFAVHLVGDLYRLDDYVGVEAPMRKLIESCVEAPGVDPLVEMAAVWYVGQGVRRQRRVKEYKELVDSLAGVVNVGDQPVLPVLGCSTMAPTVLSKPSLLVNMAGGTLNAESWLRKAWKAQEDGGLRTGPQILFTLNKLGWYAQKAQRPREAEAFFMRALQMSEVDTDPEDLSIANALYGLGWCALGTGRPGEAEVFFKRELRIRGVKLDPDDLSIASTLYGLAWCALDTERVCDAEALFRRELTIREAKLGPNDLLVAHTVNRLGLCAREAGRLGEAEGFFKRALAISEGQEEEDDLFVATTLYAAGCCIRKAGRPIEAETCFRRSLAIIETRIGPDDLSVASVLDELAWCILEIMQPGEAEGGFKRITEIGKARGKRDDLPTPCKPCEVGPRLRVARGLGEAESFFKRALDISTGKVERDDLSFASTLDGLGRCVLEMDRPEEAKGFLREALGIREANKKSEDLSVADTLHMLGRSILEAGRPREAEGFLKRALSIGEAKLGPGHLFLSQSLNWLGVCAREAGWPGEAERFFKRAQKIGEANGNNRD